MPEVKVKDLTVSFRVYHDRLPQIKDYLLGLLSKKKNTLAHSEHRALNNISFSIKPAKK